MKPMLAVESDQTKLKFPCYASPKLDGVRALVKDGVVLSRSLKPIPNKHVQERFGRPEYEGLDGELMLGDPTHPDVYRITVSAVMSQDDDQLVCFHLFDRWDRDYSYNRVSLPHTAYAHPVTSVLVHDLEELERFEARCLKDGYEGVMLRSPDSPYKFGRSTVKEGYLLKLKRFADSEAEILDFEELMSNQNEATTNELGRTERSSHKSGLVPAGVLGALVVRDIKTGVTFKIGSGFTAAERASFWSVRAFLKGSLVKYQYFPGGSKDKPRFPTYLGFRDHIDL